MELKPGYKMTEIGVIPKDWDVRFVRDFAFIITGPFGTLLKASEYSEVNGVPLISVGEVGKGKFKITEQTPRVPSSVTRRLPQYLLRKGDIVFGRKGAVERSALVSEGEAGWFLGSDGISVRPKPDCLPSYVARQFQSCNVQTWLLRNATGTTMPSLNDSVLGSVQIPFAPMSEQRSIANLMREVDVCETSLERLIAKKRDMKQGAMQQLLTGQTRLPGFTNEWRRMPLKAVAHVKTGNKNNEDKTEDGIYPFFVRSDSVERINSFSHDCEAVLVPGEGRIGEIFHYINGKFAVHQRVYTITKFAPGISAKFVYLYMSHYFGEWALQNTVKATVDSLRLPTFNTFELALPTTLEEQIAIAAVLSDMDAELAALEQRLAKTRALKQGTMQELLTGRIRLVVAESAQPELAYA